MTTTAKTQKNCSECGQPGATGRTMNLSGERVWARLHADCKKIVEARHAEWEVSPEGVAALGGRATLAPEALIYGCDAAGSAWIRANVGLD
jgi:hypothetical protein